MNWSAFDNPQSLILGGLMFVTAFVLWRNSVLTRRLRMDEGSASPEMPASTTGRAASQLAQTANTLQVELHDFVREVEGRIAHKTSTLDQLLQETDAELQRLEELLETQRHSAMPSSHELPERTDAAEPPITVQQRRMIGWLFQAGFSAQDIAHCVQLEQHHVECCLREFPGDDRHHRAA